MEATPMTTPTQAQMDRVAKDYAAIAKEPVTPEFINGVLYVWASELAALRIYAKMANAAARVAYSENMGCWYFSIGLKLDLVEIVGEVA
jgi:hypothetical protein